MHKNLVLLTASMFLLVLAACSGSPEPADPLIPEIAFESGSAGEVKPGDRLVLAGTGSARNEGEITITESLLVRIRWQTLSASSFKLVVSPVDSQDQSEAVTFVQTQSVEAGEAEWVFGPGSYVIRVESNNGEWQVEWEAIEYADDPFDMLSEPDS